MTSYVGFAPDADPSILMPRPEHDELRDVVRALLARVADHESVRVAADGELGYSADVWRRLNQELDISAMLVPEELGGAGFGLADIAVVLEETGAALLPEPVLVSSVLAAFALSSAQDPAAVEQELAQVASGETVGTVALAPADDLVVEAGRATGTLRRVVAGAVADVIVFSTATGVYLVRREDPAVAVTPLEVLDPTRRQADVRLSGAAVTVIAEGETAARVASRLERVATIAAAAEHVGIIGRQLETTLEYVKQRQQFGRVIGSFQAVKHRLADVLVGLERSRSAVAYAAALFDRDPDAELPTHVAGAVVTDAVIATVHEAVQLHGGIGFTWEHSAHYYVRRALGDEAIFGSARAHRQRLADAIGI